MLGWLHRMVVAVFGSAVNARRQVKPTLIASQRARAESRRVQKEARPHIDRSRALIASYEASDAALRGHR